MIDPMRLGSRVNPLIYKWTCSFPRRYGSTEASLKGELKKRGLHGLHSPSAQEAALKASKGEQNSSGSQQLVVLSLILRFNIELFPAWALPFTKV